MSEPAVFPGLLRFALYAGLTDLRSSIRRTGLGPLWSTIGLALVIAILGLFFGTVLKQQLPDYDAYIPFLAAGLIAWTFLATSVHQANSHTWTFLNTLRHTRITLVVPVIRVMIHSGTVLLLNLAAALVAARLYFGAIHVSPWALGAGLALSVANVFWMSYASALFCARFRDMPQLVAWGSHLAFFLTPILWVEYNLGRFEYLARLNPFTHLVAILRQPLLGQPVATETWLIAGLMACGGGALCWALGRHFARRLPYWL